MITWKPSPHFIARREQPSAVVIYDGGSNSPNLDLFETTRLSCHYAVQRSGEILHYVEDMDVAFHAPNGAALFGRTDVNGFALGIELAEAHNDKPYTDDQIGSLISLVTALCYEYKIPLNKIVGPSHLAIVKEADARQKFPWFDFLVVVGARISELQLTTEDAHPSQTENIMNGT